MNPRRWLAAAVFVASFASVIEAFRIARRASRAMETASNGNG